jgi:hypothetical protein
MTLNDFRALHCIALHTMFRRNLSDKVFAPQMRPNVMTASEFRPRQASQANAVKCPAEILRCANVVYQRLLYTKFFHLRGPILFSL